MPSHTCFLRLPAEVRLIIYRHYVVLQGGRYFYNFAHNKLTAANNEPIDLSLMYTCKLIAAEMRGVALGTNTIYFSCVSSRDRGTWFGLPIAWEQCMDTLWALEHTIFSFIEPYITQSMRDELARAFPQLMPALDDLASDSVWARWQGLIAWDNSMVHFRGDNNFGEAPSVYRRFVSKAVQLASTHELFAKEMQELLDEDVWGLECDAFAVIELCHDAAVIPTVDYISRLFSLTQDKGISPPDERTNSRVTSHAPWMFRWSAAAAAMYFLSSLSSSTRLQMRDIFLHEDRQAVAWPEGHAQGLIQFCRENPKLRIERHVDLWRNVFQFNARDQHRNKKYRVPKLEPVGLTRGIATWIMEALALAPAGMPEQSFTLILDGDPAPKLCAEIFPACGTARCCLADCL